MTDRNFRLEDRRVAQLFRFAVADPDVRLSCIKCGAAHLMGYVVSARTWSGGLRSALKETSRA